MDVPKFALTRIVYSSYANKMYYFTIQWGPINGITLELRETDSYNRLILISEQTKDTLGRK
jgi:hypothetical protein